MTCTLLFTNSAAICPPLRVNKIYRNTLRVRISNMRACPNCSKNESISAREKHKLVNMKDMKGNVSPHSSQTSALKLTLPVFFV